MLFSALVFPMHVSALVFPMLVSALVSPIFVSTLVFPMLVSCSNFLPSSLLLSFVMPSVELDDASDEKAAGDHAQYEARKT